MKKRLLQFDDLYSMEYISYPALAPDGSGVLFVKSIADRETGLFVPHIYFAPFGGGETRRLLEGAGSAYLPRFSPDGRLLAYISDASGERQLWLRDMQSGESRQLTAMRHGISWFSWAPDSRRLTFTAAYWQEEEHGGLHLKEMTPQEKQTWLLRRSFEPDVAEELVYKLDETFGVKDGSFTHIGIVDTEGREVKMLTGGTEPDAYPVFSPDGAYIAFYRKPYHDFRGGASELYIMGSGGANVRQLTTGALVSAGSPPCFTPDGSSLIYTAYHTSGSGEMLNMLYRVPCGGGEAELLMPEEACPNGVDPLTDGCTVYGEKPSAYCIESGSLYYRAAYNGETHLYRLPLADGAPQRLTEGNAARISFDAPRNGKLALIRSDWDIPAEVWLLDTESGEERRVTHSNAWLADCALTQPRELRVESADKKAVIHGFCVPPAERRAGERYPAVLDIHGGPQAFYPLGFWFQCQMLAASGFAVIYCDPRGSAGFGAEFMKTEYADGQEAYDDLMTFTDAAAELGFIDVRRIGLTGGSYGGKMTNKIIGLTDRFKAAVAQRTFVNPATSYGTGDMGFISASPQKPRSFVQHFENRAARSLLCNIDKVNTPLLLLHGYLDFRCSFEQSEQFFIAMKSRRPDVPVKLVAFRDENHALTRTGKMHNQINHMKAMIGWFKKYL
ncbi:MAG: S9 family peptidase [Clostridia bacterium]|nr:S9 family peptidase [Clostridia bacterium]